MSDSQLEDLESRSQNDTLESESLTESVFNYHKENGRTYHSFRAGSYYFPNDGLEVERLDHQHAILRTVMNGRNYLAPWSQEKPPRKVLDVCTGTGRWAVEMGDEFPGAAIVGIDLSPIQPTIVPPNVSFFVEDATEDWHEQDLDYVHARLTAGCWSDMYTQLVTRAFGRLRPGGWLEAQEITSTFRCGDSGSLLPDNSALSVWRRDLDRAAKKACRPLGRPDQLKAWFAAAGFVDVQERVYRLPTNAWPCDPRLKRIGELWQANLEAGLQGFSYGLLHRELGKSKAEIEVSLVDVRKDIANQQTHSYQELFIVCGRKP